MSAKAPQERVAKRGAATKRHPGPVVPKAPRSRLVRDPIHGDIPISALEAAVIDSRPFQRLRYIRQNALLHFVFPGAVHTRFAHSIGTMAVADLVLRQLSTQLDARLTRGGLSYISAIFRLGALLHDIGHCAFSHSTEKVEVDGGPLFGSLRELLTRWNEPNLLRSLERAGRDVDSAAQHEEIGLALVRHVFRKDTVATQCRSIADATPDEVAEDVCAMMAGDLPSSAKWRRESERVHELIVKARARDRLWGRVDSSHFAADLLNILHSLVSGTLDVDRMDYLIRDSYHCGVPYGECDVPLLIHSLSVGGVNGRLELFLSRKAVDCLDDLLWSRYQLFVQVLNHKANVGMNTLLSEAISDAIADSLLDRPETLDQYLLFTDDHVMATITKACYKGRLDKRRYAKTLVDRRLPLHLGAEDDPGTEAARKKTLKAKAAAAGIPSADVFVGVAESVVLKPGRFPSVLDWNRATRSYDLYQFEQFSHFTQKGVASRRRVLHYYADRDNLIPKKKEKRA